MKIEFPQWDWIPGFAAFIHSDQSNLQLDPDARAFCVLNLGSHLATIASGDAKAVDLPYQIARDMMHEVIHALEAWAGVEFSEERVEKLIDDYQKAIGRTPPDEEFVHDDDFMADKVWEHLKARCAATRKEDLDKVKALVMVRRDDIRAAITAAVEDPALPEQK